MAYQFQNISVLVVEDNQPMMGLVWSLLTAFGVKDIAGAPSGQAGFESFCRLNPDIILADWMMDDMDGIELTRMIRTHRRSPNPYVPIILMTGFSERRRVLEARDAGVTEFLVKPFNANDLYRRLSQVIERPRQFVIADDFFGPDRRRLRTQAPDYDGPLKRETDAKDPLYARRVFREQSGKADINPDDIDFA